jgi:hypothetical protein
MQTKVSLQTPADVLNFALTLELMLHAFYRDGLQAFTSGVFAAAGYAANVFEWLSLIREQEKEHVDVLTKAIRDLGGEPVGEAQYDFGYSDPAGFINVARVLERIGVSAYQGAAQYLIGEHELLTAALTIHGVEARHAAYLNGLQEISPFPDAFNPALTPDAVLMAVGKFFAVKN